MAEYKYFSPDVRVKLTKNNHINTTIIAVFQKRLFWLFWKIIKEVIFDVYDYEELGKGNEFNDKQIEERKGTHYQYVTITYHTGTTRELWKPEYFNLEACLEKYKMQIESKEAI